MKRFRFDSSAHRLQRLALFAAPAVLLPALAISRCASLVSPAVAQTAAPQTTRAVQTNPAIAPYKWSGVRVGGGGFIPGIVFSRAERNLAYLRSDMGGAYRWDNALQTWIPLHDNFSESSYFGTESIAPDPVDPNTVYIAAGMYQSDPAAFLRSRDRGKTWQAFPVPFRMGGNNDGRGLGERLAVDPNDTRILYFGSRHDGLMKSTDNAQTWIKVASFPLAGRGVPQNGTNGGLSFVVFDPTTGTRGQATRTIFVGSADPGNQHMYRSDDAGATWKPIAGEPKAEFLPAKAEIDNQGTLYITYSNGIGPNGVTDGAVMKLNTRTNVWTDITPDKRANRPAGGYMGISLDRQNPGTLGVVTMNRWGPIDTVWRSTDGGATWADIVEKSTRDTSEFPFLSFGVAQAKLGWWMSAFAIDPFNSDHATYATGATIYSTRNFSDVNKNAGTAWKPWVQGIEQTAVITLMSPPVGANLISGFGDIGGFVHDDFKVSPQLGMFTNPVFGNTNTLEYAGAAPNVIVRSGRPHSGEASLAYSEDSGRSWQPLVVPVAAPAAAPVGGGRRNGGNGGGNPAIITGADGKTFIVMTTPAPQLTRDNGKTWTEVQGLPAGGRPIADRVNSQKFYALDYGNGALFISTDGGATFTATPTTGLPADISRDRAGGAESAWTFQAASGREGDLWLVSRQGLFHSTDSGKTFARTGGNVNVELLSFGKAPTGSTYPALFAVGRQGETRALWRSDNAGQSWIRINDAEHQWGNRFRCLAADPRVFGRVYVGTDGRGILVGEPAA